MIDLLNQKELLALLKDFYLLTGIKIVLFDASYQEILAYPATHCDYCRKLRSTTEGEQHCIESNIRSFQHCERTQTLTVYHCHAGLVEATAPLIDNGLLIGYIMFGQITDISDPNELRERFPSDHLDIIQKSPEEISAAAKILEACTFYVLLKRLLQTKRHNFIENIKKYIWEHLSENLTVDDLLVEFQISRSHLYRSAHKYLGMNIAEYIRRQQLEKAKLLLQTTDMPISQIAEQTGFADYNYFCRVFKRVVGMPAKKYRSQISL